MPKMKSTAGAKKRFKRTGTGKLKRMKAFRSHMLSTKSSKRKRHLRKSTLVSVEEQKKFDMMLQM
ncbi:MAG TPA: 50S ribosomal protein L35 [Bacteroidota bacterium]|jgi:large subunit ribosomal protein L35|nr:50S ribosomal protein L35 [Bacteroidota bacterium]